MSAQQTFQYKEILSNHYKLLELSNFEQLHLGYLNISYILETGRGGKRKKYFFRRYKEGIKEEEIKFEHSIIRHLAEREFTLIADVIPTQDGKTYVRRLEGDVGEKKEVFYSVFDYLPGNDKYTWVNPRCVGKEIENAAIVLAQFHNTVSDLDPVGKRQEPGILGLLPDIASFVEHCSQNLGNTIFDSFFRDHLSLIQDNLAMTQEALITLESSTLPQQVIHSDYHPGNLKFQGTEIVGLFDFDWSKVDFRCFDIALAITYFFSSWAEKKDGELDLEKTGLFIHAYQNSLEDRSGIGPLNAAELTCLPHMISASNLYVFNWTIRDFYGNKMDPEEYLIYLQHGVNFMKWLVKKENLRKLGKLIAKIAYKYDDENN